MQSAVMDIDRKNAAPRGARAQALAEAQVERRCLVTGKTQDRTDLIRFAISPEGVVLPDIKGKLGGRGLWVGAHRAYIEEARRKKLFARAAKRPVTVPPDLADQVEKGLKRQALNMLGFARRAGDVVAGFEKAREWASAGRAAILVEACDGAADGKEKLRRLAPNAARIEFFSAEELGGIFGRDHVVHAAIQAGAMADKLLDWARQVDLYECAPDEAQCGPMRNDSLE